MPRAFAITPATPSVRLNASGQGEFSFAVSNALGRPVRARITVVPEGNTRRDWLSVAGESERDFASDGTQQVTIRVSAPAGTPQGAYTFHPLVSSVTNPDEDYADGPTVTFEVSPTAAPKKPFPWWIVAVAGGVVVILVIAGLVFSKLKGGGGQPVHSTPCNDTDQKCAKGLACLKRDPTSPAQCLALVDTRCKANTDCESQLCADGKCAEPPPGARCLGDAECPPSQKCVEARPGVKACLLRQDRKCASDIECSSGFCTDARTCSRDDGRCTEPTKATDCRPGVSECRNNVCLLVQGQQCTQDTQCTTGFCNGTCQPTPPCVPPCLLGNICVRGVCRPRIIFQPLDPSILRRAQPLEPIIRDHRIRPGNQPQTP